MTDLNVDDFALHQPSPKGPRAPCIMRTCSLSVEKLIGACLVPDAREAVVDGCLRHADKIASRYSVFGPYVVVPASAILSEAFSFLGGQRALAACGVETRDFLSAMSDSVTFVRAVRTIAKTGGRESERLVGAPRPIEGVYFAAHVFPAGEVLRHLENKGDVDSARSFAFNLRKLHAHNVDGCNRLPDLDRVLDHPVAWTLRRTCHFLQAGDVVVSPKTGRGAYRLLSCTLPQSDGAQARGPHKGPTLEVLHEVCAGPGRVLTPFLGWKQIQKIRASNKVVTVASLDR